MAEQKLTIKQETFCYEYVKDGNATRAYRVAYNAENMLEATINTRACKLVKEYKISTRLDGLRKEIQSNAIADIQEIKEFFTETLRSVSEDVKDRTKAAELLGKTMGAFIDRTEVKTQLEVNYYAPEKNKDN